MKISVKREFDGEYYVGSSEQLPGCFVQSHSAVEIPILMRNAVEIYRKSYQEYRQTIQKSDGKPLLDIKIRFNTISTKQLQSIFKSKNYHVDYQDQKSILLINSNFPFNRVHLPATSDLSPLIIQKIFGKANVTVVRSAEKKSNRNVI